MPTIGTAPREEEEEEEGGEEDEEDEEEDGNDNDKHVPAPPAPTLRVVFLDIDGVLNVRPDSRQVIIDPGCCALLKRLVQETGAQLVLSTPWRRHAGYILDVLKNFNVFVDESAPQSLDATPFNADSSRRDLEILQWLNSHRGQVASWAVLDTGDLLRFASAPRLEGHVIRVGDKGLMPEHIEASVAILGRARPKKVVVEENRGQSAAANADYRSSLAMDEDLVTKMEALMGLLPSNAPSTCGDLVGRTFVPTQRKSSSQQSGTASEFDAVMQEAKNKFAVHSVFST